MDGGTDVIQHIPMPTIKSVKIYIKNNIITQRIQA
jgi:hypothetical protein